MTARMQTWFLLVIGGLGGLLYGIDFGVIAVSMPYIKALKIYTDAEVSWIVGAVMFGGILASATAGVLCDRLGRKAMIAAAAALFLVAIPIVCFSGTSLAVMLTGRVLQGMSAGYMAVVMPMYLAECLPADLRGRGTGIFQLFLGIGLVTAAAVGILIAAIYGAADASAELAAKMAELGPDTVSANGFAPIANGGVPAAQKAALASAKSAAVEMVLGSAVASTEVALNMNAGAKVFSNAGGFIESFRVTEESDRDGVWKVTILAKVAKDRLMKDYGAALAQFGNVKFHVEKTGRDDLDALLEEKFTEWKCPLTSNRSEADYLVWARWEFADETHPMDGRDGTRLTLTIRMLDAATGKEYFAVNNDPRKAVSFIGDQRRRIRNAADLAMKEIHEKIHAKLDAMIGTMTASGRDIRMVFDNYSEAYADSLEAIRAAAETIPGCNTATVKINGTARMAEIGLRCQTDMDTFRKLMEEAMGQAIPSASMRPDTVSCDANTWGLSW